MWVEWHRTKNETSCTKPTDYPTSPAQPIFFHLIRDTSSTTARSHTVRRCCVDIISKFGDTVKLLARLDSVVMCFCPRFTSTLLAVTPFPLVYIQEQHHRKHQEHRKCRPSKNRGFARIRSMSGFYIHLITHDSHITASALLSRSSLDHVLYSAWISCLPLKASA